MTGPRGALGGLLLAVFMLAPATAALPPRSSVIGDARRALKYWEDSRGWNHTACGWEYGTFMLGVTALARAANDSALRDWAVSFGDAFDWDLCSTGVTPNDANPDNQVCAATYADLLLTAPPGDTANASWIAAARKQYDSEVAAAAAARAAGTPRRSSWSWIDAVFMAASVYGRVAAATGEARYLDYMYENLDHALLAPDGFRLWSEAEGLFHRDPPGDPPSNVFWARGNGWAMGALVAALEFTPASDPRRAPYERLLEAHAAALAALQAPDGCWRVSLLDPGFYDVPETTGTAMFTYGIAWGIRAGLLPADAFTPSVEAAWGCLSGTSLLPSGRVGWCQSGGAGPHRNIFASLSSDFCVGQFLLAASEVSKLTPP